MTITAPISETLTGEERRALLKSLLERNAKPQAMPTLVPDPVHKHEPFPLTEIQQAYWLGRDPAFPLGGVGIHGYLELDCRDLDVARLEAAWNDTIRRHDMMRVVVQADGTARILESPPRYEIEVEDLTAATPERRQQRLADLRARMSHQVYDVSRWPLFEIRALRLDAHTTRLLYSEDAIHIDLASSELVMDEWLRLYRGERLPRPRALSFRDYACALDARRRSRAHAKALQDWRARLAGLPGPPDLPRAAADNGLAMSFQRRKMTLDAKAWAALKRAAAAQGLTPSDVLLTAYTDVLGGWSTARRFLVNVTLQRRLPLHPDINRVAGDFTSFTLLDVDVGGGRSFVERAILHRGRLWRELDDLDVSGPELLRELAAARGANRSFVVPYVYTSALGTAGYRRIGSLGEIVHEVTQTPQVLIDQQVLEDDGALVLSWDSVDGAFPSGLIDTMFGCLEELVRSLAAGTEPWQRRGGLPIPREQRAVRDAMNATGGAFPDLRLEELLRRRVREQPDAVAVIDRNGAMTYRELDFRSSALAGALAAEEPPGRGEPVGIALPRGRDQIVAIFAALKAGAAYVPLDLSSPPLRIARVLDLAACRHAIVDPARPFAGLPEHLRLISVSAAGPAGAAGAGARSPRDTAYVLFTSGSTGDPKGVPISHASVVNRMHDVVTRFSLDRSDRGLTLTKLHHDLSVFDVFGLIAMAGGSLAMAEEPAAGPGDPQEWIDLIDRHGVTVWNSVPGLMEMLLASRAARAAPLLASLRLALLSGDWIPPAMPARIGQLAPQARVISLGGPTETTVWDICHAVDRTHRDWPSVPYGRPMRNAQYEVLRDDLSECPDWVTGELCLSGIGLTEGYLNPTPEDAARFVVDPVSGRRRFRSGDLGRVRPGGEIEFLGRRDRQVKIGGHRIELGEVEAALRCDPSVARAVAFSAKSASGQDILAAAFTVATGPDAGAAELVVPIPAGGARGGERRSALAFSRRTLQRVELARLLAFFRPLTDEQGETRRLHASAGRRYAVSIFVQVQEQRINGLAGGLYRFDAALGRLAFCGGPPAIDIAAHAPRNRALAADAAVTLLLAASPASLQPDYGDGWRDLCLVEAGYMGQLAMEAAASVGLGICPIGGLDTAALPLPDDMVVLHALVAGAIPGAGAEPACAAVDASDLRALLASRLPPQMIPAVLLRLDTMPATSVGKPDIVELRRLAIAASGDKDAGEAVAPKGHRGNPAPDLLLEVREAVAAVLGRADISDERALQEAGVTSIDMVRIHARLLDAGYRLAVTDMFRFPNIAALAGFMGDASVRDVDITDIQSRADERRAVLARRGRRRDA
jgi:epothilone synthetase B